MPCKIPYGTKTSLAIKDAYFQFVREQRKIGVIIKQKDIAMAMDLNPSTFANLLNGRSPLHTDFVITLCHHMRIDPCGIASELSHIKFLREAS